VVKNQRKNKVPKNIPAGKKMLYNPCEEKRMRSGADYEPGHNFSGTEQEMYGRRRGRRYTSYTVSLASY